ncbi:MAG: lysophospholipid acyltransferase family protein, partial [Flavobacteriales bacterium]
KGRKLIPIKKTLQDENASVVIFPEGTRSEDGKLLPFKNGAFKLAKEMGTPLLPITINGTKNVLPKKHFNVQPGKPEIIIHDPVYPENFEDMSIMKEKVRDIINQELI